MKINGWLNISKEKLKKAGIESARLDCLLLLEDVIKKDRAYILANADKDLSTSQIKKLDSKLKQRANHEPMAYIIGNTEFYGRIFKVNKNVMVPRPESEDIINLLKSVSPHPKTILDLGTGSGCLAITAKLELPKAKVLATDIDNNALKVAKNNAKSMNSEVEFFELNKLASLPLSGYKKPMAILANLPYVPDEFEINEAAKFEPKIALFGGPDGLNLYKGLFRSLSDKNRVQYVFTESLEFQHEQLAKIAKSYGFSLKSSSGLAQLFISEAVLEA